MKKVLIIGSEGYVGPLVIKEFESDHEITCLDTNWFKGSQLSYVSEIIKGFNPKISKVFGDVRNGLPKFLMNEKFDSVIYLAAVSNDPIGKDFADQTHEINTKSAIKIAEECKKNGVKNFLYASSCSVYGNGKESTPVNENDKINPLTDYSISKNNTENELKTLVDKNFKVGCLRFATASGPSTNMRFDLVINDFIITALKTSKIEIKSNGKPWRPIINTMDMARAFRVFNNYLYTSNENFIVYNVGFNDWNFTVEDIANKVKDVLGNNISISIDIKAPDDKRSYRVNFDNYQKLSKDGIQPVLSFEDMIKETTSITKKILNLKQMELYPEYFDKRHSTLKEYISNNKMNNNLNWINI